MATAMGTASSSTSGARNVACSTRAGRTPATPIRYWTGAAAQAPDRPGRGPGLRLRCQAADGGPRPGARRGRPGGTAGRRGRDAGRPLRGRLLGRGPALLRDGARRRQAPVRRDRRATPGSACGRASSRPNERATSSTSCCGHRCSRAGGSGPSQPGNPATTRSGTTPGPCGRTRHVTDRRRVQTLRLRRCIEPAGRPDDGSRPALHRLPPAGALLRVRRHGLTHAGALSGRLLPAGLGGRHLVPVPADDAWPARARRPRRATKLFHPHLPDWIGKVTLKDLRVGDASVDLLFHRWRGTTSAEVLRKVGDLAVTIRL